MWKQNVCMMIAFEKKAQYSLLKVAVLCRCQNSPDTKIIKT